MGFGFRWWRCVAAGGAEAFGACESSRVAFAVGAPMIGAAGGELSAAGVAAGAAGDVDAVGAGAASGGACARTARGTRTDVAATTMVRW